MITIVCSFKSNGEDVKVTAVINDKLTELSKAKKNQATDIIDDFIQEDEVWCLYFEMNNSLGYEVQFKVMEDEETGEHVKTLKPVKAITWVGGEDACIDDVQKVRVAIS